MIGKHSLNEYDFLALLYVCISIHHMMNDTEYCRILITRNNIIYDMLQLDINLGVAWHIACFHLKRKI
jgi:hypothetical protein